MVLIWFEVHGQQFVFVSQRLRHICHVRFQAPSHIAAPLLLLAPILSNIRGNHARSYQLSARKNLMQPSPLGVRAIYIQESASLAEPTFLRQQHVRWSMRFILI